MPQSVDLRRFLLILFLCLSCSSYTQCQHLVHRSVSVCLAYIWWWNLGTMTLIASIGCRSQVFHLLFLCNLLAFRRFLSLVNLYYNYSYIFIQNYLFLYQFLNLVTAEVMPESAKELGITVSNIVLAISGCLVLKFMPTLSEALGFHFTMYLFGVIGIPCGLFIVLFVPETKGKSYEEIMSLLK